MSEHLRRVYIITDDGEGPPLVIGSLVGQFDDDGEFDKRVAVMKDAFRHNAQIRIAEAHDDIPF